jgi:hypothetical protein
MVLSICILGSMTLLVSSCSVSTKPLYFENELAIAERATSRFHELHNAQNFEAIHALRDQKLQTIPLKTLFAKIECAMKDWAGL